MNAEMTSSSYEVFLTPTESVICKRLDPSLKKLVVQMLLNPVEASKCDMARFIIKIIDQHQSLATAITAFFLETVKDPDIFSCLERFKVLESSGQVASFFSFTAMKVWDKAQKALDSFYEKNRSLEPIKIDDSGVILDRQDIFNKECAPQELLFLALRYLRGLPELQKFPLSYYEYAFAIIERLIKLTVHEKKALIKVIVAITSGQQAATQGYQKVNLEELIERMTQMSLLYGTEVYEAFCISGIKTPICLDEFIRLIKVFNSLSDRDDIFAISERFVDAILKKDYILARERLLLDIEDKVSNVGIKEMIEQRDLTIILDRFASMPFPLEKRHLGKIASQYQVIQTFCETHYRLGINELVFKAHAIQAKAMIEEGDILELIAIVRLVICIKFGIYLHHTQILTVLAQLLFATGSVAQVKTGEGKSMIVAVMAFIHAMQNKSVHIISSSSNLAIRDKNKFENLFKTFGLVVSDVCNNPSASKFKAHILYGSASDFEFALMREMLYQTPLFLDSRKEIGSKRFDCVIVDEVDNLTIDTGLNGARLCVPAQKSYNWVYPLIFNFMQSHCLKQDILRLDAKVEELKLFLSTALKGRFSALVPDLTDEQLIQWLKSAYHVLFELKKDVDYVIQKDQILIVDVVNTGRIMHGSRWSAGIHEFAELKHDLPVQEESINPISLSHPIYYPMYKSIFGLTGTLGSSAEREEIEMIYNVHCFDVPTYHVSKRDDQAPCILPTKAAHQEAILNEIRRLLAAHRPILVLCKSIEESMRWHHQLDELGIKHELLNELQEKLEDDILDKAGLPQAVTIATNTAGRGTDIILKGKSSFYGGLHVLLTNFPESERVEEQARGRAARQGDPGSSAMFICGQELTQQETLQENLILSQLYHKRQETALLMKQVHAQQVDFERFRYTLVEQFFEKLIRFRANTETMISKLSQELISKKRLDDTKPNLDGLNPKDALIAQDSYALWGSTVPQAKLKIYWKACLLKLIDHIEQRVIIDWTINFYNQTNELIKGSLITRFCHIQELFKVINPQLSDEINSEMVKCIAQIKQQVMGHFQSKSVLWDKYLDPTGEGVRYYLHEIIQGHPIKID